MPEVHSASDLRGVLGKTLNSVTGTDKMVNVAYYSSTHTVSPSKERIRPQTASNTFMIIQYSIIFFRS